MRPIDADVYAKKMHEKLRECKEIAESSKTKDERMYWDGSFSTFIEAKLTLDNIPTLDAVPVVRCNDCVMHGKCTTEDTFRFCGIEDGYCMAGKRKCGEKDEP